MGEVCPGASGKLAIRGLACFVYFRLTLSFHKDMDVTVQNFTETLSNVDKRVQVMRQFQQLSRGLESRDYNLLEENLNYVSRWSLIQCFVVIASGCFQVHNRVFFIQDHCLRFTFLPFQVYFLRSLFNSDNRKVAGAKTQTRA